MDSDLESVSNNSDQQAAMVRDNKSGSVDIYNREALLEKLKEMKNKWNSEWRGEKKPTWAERLILSRPLIIASFKPKSAVRRLQPYQ